MGSQQSPEIANCLVSANNGAAHPTAALDPGASATLAAGNAGIRALIKGALLRHQARWLAQTS